MSAASDATRQRLQELLDSRSNALSKEAGSWEHGYLDLLGDDAPDSTGVTQDLMLTRIVPVVYERWWRPTLAWAAKGMTGPGMAEEVRIARLFLGLGRGDKVLDVACGPANFSRSFARAAGEDGLVVGIDASRTMLTRGAEDTRKAGVDNLALVRGDATALPFEDGSFDCVCCFAALHLFAEPHDALDEMHRVLSPGGRIALMTSIRRPITVRPMKPVVERLSGMRVFEPDEITGALDERGFSDVRSRVSGLVQFVGGRLAN